MARKPPKPKPVDLTYAELRPEVQEKLNEMAYESVVFRRSREEFWALVKKELRGKVARQTTLDRYTEVRKEFEKREPRATPEEKEAQRERLLTEIKAAYNAKQWQALAKLESLFADLMGTREPLRVEHVISGALVAAIGQLTPERQAELVAEQRRRFELAELAEREGLSRALPPRLDVQEAEIVDEEPAERAG